MIQLNSFCAVRYRGIDGLQLANLSRVNLITGPNGVGKTALIEAMWLYAGRFNPRLLWNPNIQRTSMLILDPISLLTHDELELHGEENGNRHEIRFAFEKIVGTSPDARFAGSLQEYMKDMPTVVGPPVVGLVHIHLDGEPVTEGYQVIHVTPSGAVLCRSLQEPAGRPDCVIETTKFQHETSDEYLKRYSSLVRRGHKRELVKAINMITGNIEDVEILTDDSGKSYLSVEVADGKRLPLHDLGGGAVRLARLLLSFSAARGGILLIDELENGVYHAVQSEIWEQARQWVNQWNVQLVATTHSGEFIDAAIDAFENAPADLSIHKLFRNERTGQVEAVTFTGESLIGARDLDLEIR